MKAEAGGQEKERENLFHNLYKSSRKLIFSRVM